MLHICYINSKKETKHYYIMTSFLQEELIFFVRINCDFKKNIFFGESILFIRRRKYCPIILDFILIFLQRTGDLLLDKESWVTVQGKNNNAYIHLCIKEIHKISSSLVPHFTLLEPTQAIEFKTVVLLLFDI